MMTLRQFALRPESIPTTTAWYLADLAEAWRQGTLERWTEHPSAWMRIGAGVGAALFGKRYFRNIRHWWDLAIRAGDPHAGD